MGNIKILSEDLVNKIAAGEVVERPASVVKELLDNAYDGNASTITIDVEDGGMKKVLVVDNGSGMSKEDVELAFKPHATSKLFTTDDLLNIHNYGFRGEALSSIASVSKVTLKSRRSEDQLGTEIKIAGGEVISISETGCPVGTSVLIEDLFYNVPARKEFVKSTQAEYRAVLSIVEAHAIANPKIGLSLTKDGKSIYTLPKDQQLEDRVKMMLGADTYEKLVPIFFEHPHIEIYGFAGKPELAGERKREQFLFVNKRNISDKQLSFAVKNAYGSLIPKNNYPVYVLFVDVPPNIVDVNVHPRKEEVKFSNTNLIFSSIKSAVKGALDRVDLTPGSQNNKDDFGDFRNFGFPASSRPTNQQSPMMPSSNQMGKFRPPFNSPAGNGAGAGNKSGNTFANTFWDSPIRESNYGKPQTVTKSKLLQIHNLYLITESEDGVLIYDQHAVHERKFYEKLKNNQQASASGQETQGMTVPVVLNLSVHESEILGEYREQIQQAGFKIEDFGPNAYKVIEIPAAAVNIDIKSLFHELLEDLDKDEEMKTTDSQTDKMLTYLSCRMAYKAGDSIPLEEAQALIDSLDETDTKYTCPHGRPVKVEITLKELSKMFKRT